MSDTCVLIVDDDAEAIDVFAGMLRAENIEVRIATDPAAALTSIAHAPPSAIVLDFHLPTMNGIDLLKQIKTCPSGADVPVVVVTGDYLIDDRVPTELRALGAALFFKPLWKDQLVSIVLAMIDGHAVSAAD